MDLRWEFEVVEVPVTVTLNAYTANDVVGGTLTSNAISQVSGQGGYISWVKLVDDADQKEPFYLYVFSEAPSTIANDAAHAPTEADWLKWLGTIEIEAADYDANGADAAALVPGKDKATEDFVFFPALANGRLYFRLVAVETPDYADADDLTLQLGIMVQ